MATYNVTTFADFMEKAATSGNTIVCPEGAVWDLAEIDPENLITKIDINSNITGNGTEIRNLRGEVAIGGSMTITALHWINCLRTGAAGSYRYFMYATSGTALLKESKMSLAVVRVGDYLGGLYHVAPYRCAIEMSINDTWARILNIDSQNATYNRYNKIHLTAPNATTCDDVGWNFQDSQLIIDAPLMTNINNTNKRCTVRGNLESCTKITGTSSTYDFSVINGDDAPNFAESGSDAKNYKKISDLQMRDAEYLASIGFVIGTE